MDSLPARVDTAPTFRRRRNSSSGSSNAFDEPAQSSIARGHIRDEIDALRRQPGGDIIAWGGATFAQALARAGLVDEYVLVINPVAFGGGLPMFRDLPRAMELDLVEARRFDTGTVLHVYRPKGR